MSWDPDDVGYPQVALAALLVATLLGLGVAASTSTVSFGAYNARWDGASDLRDVATTPETTVELASSADRYGDVRAERTVAIVLSPTKPYTDADLRRIRTFVREGGTLVVAEDYAPGGNRLLAGVGARARLDGRPLRDERYSTRSPAFLVATNTSDHAATEGVDRLVLNHGTAVEPNDATILARTSEYAYLDTNRNRDLDGSERLDRYPIATVESIGDGRVIVAGDPSLFINAMLDRSGNRQFATNVLTENSKVLLDYSHARALPPLALARLRLQDSPVLQALVGAIGIALILAWGRRDGTGTGSRVSSWLRGRRGESLRTEEDEPVALDAETVRSGLAERHPDWDDDRLRRVTQGIMARRRERRDDD